MKKNAQKFEFAKIENGEPLTRPRLKSY